MFAQAVSLVVAALAARSAHGFGYMTEEAPMLLVGNTRGGSVSSFDLMSGMYKGEVVAGLDDPDDLVMYDGSLYVSAGTTPETSAIYKCTGTAVGSSCAPFAMGGDMLRPYGFAFAGDYLYVSSFRTDEILKFDAMTGDFVEIFAKGNATEEGLVNGPNDMAVSADGTMLYVTTQGSVAVDGEADFSFGLQSKVIAFDLTTGEGSTFIDDVAPIGPFISLLGIKIVDDALFVSDFAGGVRKFDMAGMLLATYATTFTEDSHWVGNLDLYMDMMYTVAFVNDEAAGFPGVVLKYDVSSGDSVDMLTDELFIGPTTDLVRPIGCLIV